MMKPNTICNPPNRADEFQRFHRTLAARDTALDDHQQKLYASRRFL
jgi:hypothetical protein